MYGVSMMAKFDAERALINVLLPSEMLVVEVLDLFLGGLIINQKILSSFNHHLWQSAGPIFLFFLVVIYSFGTSVLDDQIPL